MKERLYKLGIRGDIEINYINTGHKKPYDLELEIKISNHSYSYSRRYYTNKDNDTIDYNGTTITLDQHLINISNLFSAFIKGDLRDEKINDILNLPD